MTKRGVVLLLGTTQTLAWASSYYIPAILAGAMARDLGIHTSTVFVAFSCAMLLTAFLGPRVGRAIDQYGGRGVLLASNGVFILGLSMLALSTGPVMLFAAWLMLGLAMAMGLYDAGFATLARLYGKDARGAITGITLLAGFASTVGWPLSGIMLAEFGWRGACWGWALIHLLVALPLNLMLPRAGLHVAAAAPAAPTPQAARETRRTAILIAFIFAVGGFSAAALAAHLPALLEAAGATPAAAIAAGALMGPAQVAARVLEFTLLRRAHPLLSAKLAQAAHPIGAAILLFLGAPFAAAFVLLHGAGNGINTIVRGTLPLAIFGPAGYGARQGLLVAPTRFLGALAPALFGYVVEGFGAQALWFTAAMSLAALAALFMLRVAPASPKATR